MKNKIIVIMSVLVLVLGFSSCAENTEVTTEPVEETTAYELTTEEAVTNEIQEATSNTDETEETTEEAVTSETAEETTVAVNNATLTVEQVEDITGENGTVFNASSEEYAFYAVFKSDIKITDIKVLGLTFLDADENGNITFEKEVLHIVDEIGPDFNLAVHLTADGTIPSYGISYVDSDGTEKAFSVNLNGEDGSLYLAEIE